MIEFEVKARVPPDRLASLRGRLGAPLAVEAHADEYWHHPARDFAVTDEALRLSQRAGKADLTYKGPKLDAGSKARREIVLPLAQPATARELLSALGFAPARIVRKTRERYHAAGFDLALDMVPELGAFVEVERLVPEDADRRALETEARALLSSWGLHELERRSYLELLMAR